GCTDLTELPARIDALVAAVTSPKDSLGEKMAVLPLLGDVARWFPVRRKGRGECQQVVHLGDEARLSMLPALQCWPANGGRFVTLPLVHTVDPERGVRNVGMYRMQIFDDHSAGLHWHRHKTGARHYAGWRARGERMPVAVALGGDPAYTYCATAPLPDGIDEYLLAGFLRGSAVRMVKCVTNDLYVPADCDFIIEGYVDTSEPLTVEGPFGDHTGFYSLTDLYPRLHVTAITHRKDAVWPATIVGVPPQEDAYISEATERIFLAPIRLLMQPEIRDMWMPVAGVSHNLTLLEVECSYAGQGAKVASSMWGAGQMMFNKLMILTASAVGSVRNLDLLSALVRGADLERAVIRSRGVLDVLDHATPEVGVGGKFALDLTTTAPDPQTKFANEYERWSVEVCYKSIDEVLDVAQLVATSERKYIVVVEPAAALLSPEELLWFVAGNVEADRDIVLRDNRLVIDGRTKRAGAEGMPKRWPNPVTSSRATIELVDNRWNDYGLGDFIPSPSL
ncbi:MAG: UbiD family decarboxylase, partial [Tidjanibacter sp.]|nr:UbiD family decarboxylase [Tidjanibacter sp.]